MTNRLRSYCTEKRRIVRNSESEADATSFQNRHGRLRHDNNKEDMVGNERQTDTGTNSRPSQQCWWTAKGVWSVHGSHEAQEHGLSLQRDRHRRGEITNLLSRNVPADMGIVCRLEQVDTSGDHDARIGLTKAKPVVLKLKAGAEPLCLTTARRVPFPLMDAVKTE